MPTLFALWVMVSDLALRVAPTSAQFVVTSAVFLGVPAILYYLAPSVRRRAPALPAALALVAPFVTALPARWANVLVAIPCTSVCAGDCGTHPPWREMAGLSPAYPWLALVAGLLAIGAWYLAPAFLSALEPTPADELPPFIDWLRLSTALAVIAAAVVLTQRVGAPTLGEYLESLPVIARLEAEPPPHGPAAAATVVLTPQSTPARPTVEYIPAVGGGQATFALLLDDRPLLHSRLLAREPLPLDVREDVVGGLLYFSSGEEVVGVRSGDLASKLVLHRHLISRLRPAPCWRIASVAGLALAGLIQLARRRARTMYSDALGSVYRQPAGGSHADAPPPPWLATFDAWSIAVLATSCPPLFSTWLMQMGVWA